MADEITIRQNGFAEMAYADGGPTPWHTLGNIVPFGADIETWQKASGTDFEYHRSMVQFAVPCPIKFVDGKTVTSELLKFASQEVLYRSDTRAPMSTASKKYKIFQPAQMLNFFRNLISDAGFKIETVGTLKGGQRIWALAKTNFETTVLNGDKVKAYLLLVTSCDGSLATTAVFTSVRVVCWNTLAMALDEVGGSGMVKVRHNTIFDPVAVQSKLGLLAEDAFGKYVDSMRVLTKIKMGADKAEDFLKSLLKTSAEHGDVRKTKGYQTLMNLFRGEAIGSEIEGVQGTYWGMLNAVTEYVDHSIRAQSIDNRFNSGQFGEGAKLKQKALGMLLTA